jgi:pimeloyl-ACP methyl ester carboxylesterase
MGRRIEHEGRGQILVGADPERGNAETFLNTAKKYQEQEIEYFRKEIPNGRVVVFTNADHHCFIDKETEVVAEMRAFWSTSKPAQ